MERLLLIDDDKTTREVLTALLGAEGWFVTEAASGDEAVALATSVFPQVILSDLQMPGLSGAELASALHLACEEPPVLLAMTATPKGELPLGFDALLVKPFDPAEVRRLCQALPVADTSSPDESSQDLPALSSEAFHRLRNAMPAEQLYSLYDFALTDADLRITRMEAAAHAEDDDTFRKEAHALKGSCGMIGAERLKSLAGAAEEAGVAQSMPSIDFPAFRKEIDALRRMLNVLLPHDI